MAQWISRLRDLASKCGIGSVMCNGNAGWFLLTEWDQEEFKSQDDCLLEEDASSQMVTLTKLVEIATNKKATINASKQWGISDASINFTRLKDVKTNTN